MAATVGAAVNEPNPPSHTIAGLHHWLRWLGTPDCTCPQEWRSLGTLYMVSMGKGWVRMNDDPACPYHGADFKMASDPT